MARGVGSQLVVCVHSTPALSTMVQSLSWHLLTPNSFNARSAPERPDKNHVQPLLILQLGLSNQLPIISRADHWGDKKHSPLVTDLYSLKAIMPEIMLNISWKSQSFTVLHQRCTLEGTHTWFLKKRDSLALQQILLSTLHDWSLCNEGIERSYGVI